MESLNTLEIISPSWETTADQVRRADQAGASALREMILAGEMLAEMKKAVGHGNFLDELRKNLWPSATNAEFQNHRRRVSRYIKIASAARAKLQMGHDVPFAKVLEYQGDENALSDARARAEALIESTTATQLLFEFSNSKPPHQTHHPRRRTIEERDQAAREGAWRDLEAAIRAMRAAAVPHIWALIGDANKDHLVSELKNELKNAAADLISFLNEL